MNFRVTVTPVSGDPSIKKAKIDSGNPTVGDVLEKAGVSAGKEFLIFVGGRPATLATAVPDGANIALTEKAAGS